MYLETNGLHWPHCTPCIQVTITMIPVIRRSPDRDREAPHPCAFHTFHTSRYTITMIPVIEQLAAESAQQLDVAVLAWALAFGACFGGNGTLIGASANIVTSGLAEKRGHTMGFMTWLRGGIPVTIVSVAIANVYMLLRYCT